MTTFFSPERIIQLGRKAMKSVHFRRSLGHTSNISVWSFRTNRTATRMRLNICIWSGCNFINDWNILTCHKRKSALVSPSRNNQPKNARMYSVFAFGFFMLVGGMLIDAYTCPAANSCNNALDAISGFMFISSFIVIPVSLVIIFRRKAQQVKDIRYYAQQEQLNDLDHKKRLMDMTVKITNCPFCGAPLDIASVTDSDVVTCQYCRNSVRFKS